MVLEVERPRWQRDVTRFLPVKPQLVLSGNVRDMQLSAVGSGVAALSLTAVLAETLFEAGYGRVVSYDPVGGFRVVPRSGDEPKAGTAFLERLGLTPGADGHAAAGLDLFVETLERLVAFTDAPVALVVDFASRLVVRRDAPTPGEHQAFTRALVASHQARPRPHGTPRRPFFNTVVWIADREGDLPDWLLVGNPRIRHVPVAKPDHGARRQLAAVAPAGLRRIRRRGSGRHRRRPSTPSRVRPRACFSSTSRRSPSWRAARVSASQRSATPSGATRSACGRIPGPRLGRSRVAGGADVIRKRVKGQDRAVTHVLDIVKRAATGVGAPGRGVGPAAWPSSPARPASARRSSRRR